ncbi:hypothetical protein [Sphingomonas sp. NIBR02145]|uniref:hypothetical protein n=1 Tax=Sphingomonas sp. NIBR02145 TaxID=3014784 RepID=UPI0022B5A00D|nr:hypothetical protein [Sphingomonas sp. NIBR02145]WHU02689.1 hypothetical protein O3305_21335 [Sphingomonas sp. NIBR02145]
MPYRHAHWYLLAIFPLAALAFWPGYLSTIGTAPLQMHAHGITATLWLALLVAQSWLIHSGNNALHRTLGATSLALFPLFLAGGSMIFLGMAQRFADPPSPFYTMYAPGLAWIDMISVAAFAWCYYSALRTRRTVQFHARYMLATVIFLLPPILGRLAPILPPLSINGPADFWKLGIGFQLGNAITAAIAFSLALGSARHGHPFFVAGAATVLGGVLFQFVGPMAAWRHLLVEFALLPPLPLALAAGIAGVGIAAAGWMAGRAPHLPEVATA